MAKNASSFPQSLYELLAQLPAPLIIISASYDNKLETVFAQHQKKFAVLSYTSEHQIYVKHCDQPEPEKYTLEALSALDLFEENTGYSLIYKINGCLELSVPKRVNENDSLVLSEQDYFEFARYQDKLVPDYLINHLTGRDLWLLGQYQQSWETRFMIQMILDKRAFQQRNFKRSNAITAIH